MKYLILWYCEKEQLETPLFGGNGATDGIIVFDSKAAAKAYLKNYVPPITFPGARVVEVTAGELAWLGQHILSDRYLSTVTPTHSRNHAEKWPEADPVMPAWIDLCAMKRAKAKSQRNAHRKKEK